MRLKQGLGGILFLLLAMAPVCIAFQNWERAPVKSGQSFSAALPHPFDPEKTFLASQDQIFESYRGSKNWKQVSPVRTGIRIVRLYHFPQFPDEVFVLAEHGLYKFFIHSPGSWRSLRESKYGETLTSFAISPEEPGRWFLGSSFHLYESADEGRTWRISSALSEDPVCFLKFSTGRFYAASEKTLYASDDLSYFKKVLSLPERPGEDLETDTENEETPASVCPFYEIISSESSGSSWAATTRGVYENDGGENWKALPQSGLRSEEVRHLAYETEKSRLFAATLEGVYSLQENHWKNIYQTSGQEEMKGLLLDEPDGFLHGITTNGFISLSLLPDNVSIAAQTPSELQLLFQQWVQLEPSSREIHHAVIRYANARNSKITRWQTESRMRALFPSVSFKKDFSDGNNIDIDRGSTSDRDTFIEGPSDISRGWDFSVSWDLGDLIFSTSQTSIDSREKLMVELRHDMTQEATRLYYERRRMQLESVLVPAAIEQDHFNRLIQIEELTALIDAMTNGLMTRKIEEIHRSHPELARIWEYQNRGTGYGIQSTGQEKV